MIIAATKAQLSSIVLETPGVKQVYAYAPQNIPNADLPLAVIFTGANTWTTISDDLAEETRTYLIRLYVTPIQSGYDGEAERRVEPFLESLRAVILKHPRLGNSMPGGTIDYILRVVYNGDTGITILPYAGQNYLGVESKVAVTSLVPVEIAKYE